MVEMDCSLVMSSSFQSIAIQPVQRLPDHPTPAISAFEAFDYIALFLPRRFLKFCPQLEPKKLLKKYRAISGHFPVNPHHSRVSPRHFRGQSFLQNPFLNISNACPLLQGKKATIAHHSAAPKHGQRQRFDIHGGDLTATRRKNRSITTTPPIRGIGSGDCATLSKLLQL